MDYFEGTYLFCSLRIGLMPGPRHFREPFYSTQMDQLEEYAAADVLRAFSSLEGVTVVAEGATTRAEDWSQWQWRWERDDRSIEIGFSVLEESEPVLWGGSDLVTSCTFADLVQLWRAVQARFPAVWLHSDDTRLFTPHSFLHTFAIPPLKRALTQPDAAFRMRAQ